MPPYFLRRIYETMTNTFEPGHRRWMQREILKALDGAVNFSTTGAREATR